TLGEAFGEFMERLPYRSRLLTIDRDTWINGGALQREVIDGLQAKLALYRRYDAAENLWVEVNPGSDRAGAP
ncbi:MAG: VWA domain-containing protein, partial [Pseudomonadota bacterium]